MNTDFFDDFGRAVSDAADTVGRKASEVAELGKLKNKIYTLEREIKRDYESIGKLIYENYKAAGEVDEDFISLCEDIAGKESLIDEYEEEIDERKKAAKS